VIDFRYHIVSIVAVFLALGLGILLGTTVLDRVVSDEFDRQVTRLTRELDTAGDRIEELSAERSTRDTLLKELAPWVVAGRLAGRPVLFVDAGAPGDWRGDVRSSLVQTGATNAGSITLTDKWGLDVEGQREELELIVTTVTPGFEPGADPARAALTLLGQRFLEPTGRELVKALAEGGFLRTSIEGDAASWPPPGSAVVVFTGGESDAEAAAQRLATLARGTSAVAPTAVVCESTEASGAVALLRKTEDLPNRLVTFDAAAADPTGVGVVLALDGAAHNRGGHFGLERGRRFLSEVPPPTPKPSASPAA
jgi:hypothetical protein